LFWGKIEIVDADCTECAVMKVTDESLAYEVCMVILYIHSSFIVQLQVSVCFHLCGDIVEEHCPSGQNIWLQMNEVFLTVEAVHFICFYCVVVNDDML
jgi:hypothetical protein